MKYEIMNNKNQLIIFEDKDKKVQVRLEQKTIWLSLNQISALFNKDKSVISRHIKNIFESGELDRESTVAKFATVQIEGKFNKNSTCAFLTQVISNVNVIKK
jgi:hypothetical protein